MGHVYLSVNSKLPKNVNSLSLKDVHISRVATFGADFLENLKYSGCIVPKGQRFKRREETV